VIPLHSSSRFLRVAAAGAVLAALSACGGPEGSSAPNDASIDDFCAVLGDLEVSDPSKVVDDMAQTGTPDGIPADARGGFEVMIDDATAEEIRDADQEKVAAFIGYVAETCGTIPGE
jgi:hypothetical protein